MQWQLLIALGVLLPVSQVRLWSAPRQMELSWNELGPRIEGEQVALVLPGGTHIQGKVRYVEPNGLRLWVSKTSDRKILSRGEQLIPRSSVSVLRVTERRVLARPVCAVGAAAAAAAIVLAGTSDFYEGPGVVIRPAVAVGGSIGMGVAGYYVGKRLDRKVTEIRVARDSR